MQLVLLVSQNLSPICHSRKGGNPRCLSRWIYLISLLIAGSALPRAVDSRLRGNDGVVNKVVFTRNSSKAGKVKKVAETLQSL
jgi:hypothetical protein